MKGYSNQEYELINSKYDEKNKVSTIDMEIRSDTNKIKVTWRIKKHKDRFFVIDFIVADISLIETKRSEFNSMLKKIDGNLSQLNDILRSKIIDEVNALRNNSVDYYAAVRSSYYQNRKAAILNIDDSELTPLPLISIEFE